MTLAIQMLMTEQTEIVSSILDHVGPVDLIRAARSCKLMHEMAYDDTRWVHKLKRIGCWDEVDARKHAERVFGTVANRQVVEQQEEGGGNGTIPAIIIEDDASNMNSLSDGFDKIELVNTTSQTDMLEGLMDDPTLTVLKQARSIRGEARQEYGKIHAALSPFYEDIAR